MKQAHLVRPKKDATVNRICWLGNDISEGKTIRFQNEQVIWNVKQVWDLQIEKGDINRGWHVGGL